VRRVAEGDLPEVVAMVHELADYERAPERCHLTVDLLRPALFGPSPALFGHVAVSGDTATDGGEVVGIALWFLNYSTWKGAHGIYLEDLFVRPAHRGGGHGRALLAALAGECVARGYPRLQWEVLDWNTPSIEFYHRLGAREDAGWLNYGLTGDALRTFAGRPGISARLRRLQSDAARLPVLDARTPDEVLGYDADGLPT
jgi:GNAT superfamily N-acetyltransferase